MTYLAIDFEYNTNTPSKHLQPVCVSVQLMEEEEPTSFWLLSHQGLNKFNEFMEELYYQDVTLLSWQAAAEARALLSLGIDPMAYSWIDLRLEFLLLYNSNFEEMEGSYLKKGGYRDEMSVYSGAKMPANLLNAKYRLLDIKPEPGYKDEMRNLILSKSEFSQEEAEAIMKYCESDIVDLFNIEYEINKRMQHNLNDEDFMKYHEQRYERADYSVLSAYMEHEGYPLYVEGARAVYDNKEKYLSDIREDFNKHYPELGLFELKKGKWTTKKAGKQKLAEMMIEKYPALSDKWPKTSPGSDTYSWDKDLVLDNFFEIKNGWTKDNPAQFFHYYRVQDSAFNSFKRPEDEKDHDKKSKTFFAPGNITTDGRMHPWMNPFGSKTSRSQPPSTTFIFGKTAWLRTLVQPQPGKAIIEIDYGGQELLIQGLVSGDEQLIYDYLQLDFYMEFAKKCDSSIPADATKKTHGEQRGLYKVAALGIGYGMGPAKLAGHITLATGHEISTGQARTIIRMFECAYPTYISWKRQVLREYQSKGYLQLKSGWTLFGGNTRHFKPTSVPNFPIQGAGADIMRSVAKKLYDRDITTIFTLHDALFVECDNHPVIMQRTLSSFTQAMREAFMEYFRGDPYYWLSEGIKLEAEIWSPDYKPGEPLIYATHPDPDRLQIEDGVVKGEIELKESEVKVKPFFLDGRAIEQLKITGDLVLKEKDYEYFKQNY